MPRRMLYLGAVIMSLSVDPKLVMVTNVAIIEYFETLKNLLPIGRYSLVLTLCIVTLRYSATQQYTDGCVTNSKV